ncbi:MAG: hypothetical protein ABI411_10250 [Tahibacter sp.]
MFAWLLCNCQIVLLVRRQGFSLRTSRIFWLIAAAIASTPSIAFACVIGHASYESALQQSDSTIIGEVIAVSPVVNEQWADRIHYTVRVLHSERGTLTIGSMVDMELVLHHAQRVNGSTRCPLQRGPGLGISGGPYRLLVGYQGNQLELYWSGSEQSLDQE